MSGWSDKSSFWRNACGKENKLEKVLEKTRSLSARIYTCKSTLI